MRCALLVLVLSLVAQCRSTYDREATMLRNLMHWREGETIAEIGAGQGQMSFFAASVVGPAGRVYTTELNRSKLDDLRQQVQRRKLNNVTVIAAGTVDTDLPANCCDVIFMRRVYHHLEKPLKTDASILRALKPGGLLAVIDFPPTPWLGRVYDVPASHGTEHGVKENIVENELRSVGFTIVNEAKDWPNHQLNDYCVIAEKPLNHGM